jgi:4-methyl-5(b-hydroxyethyl)-thiazole monophosphate biosynthesis
MKSTKTLLLLANGFETYEASVFIDVLGWNSTVGKGSTDLVTCGGTKDVKTTFNQKFVVEKIIDEINVDDYDALAIPGGFEDFGYYIDAYSEKFLSIIREFDKKGKIIASVCVGALPIGKSGVLKGRNATTYNKLEKRQKQLQEYGVNVINEPIVVDGNIITSWNPSTAINVAFLLLEKLTSREQRNLVQSLMGF